MVNFSVTINLINLKINDIINRRTRVLVFIGVLTVVEKRDRK